MTASRSLLNGLGPYIAFAHANHASYRIDEMGSVSCNGHAGVSDTMASGLWLLDALFSMARGGIDGVNLHTYPKLVNALFDIDRIHRQWTADVHPLYYGALMFAQAAPAGSRQLPVAVPAGLQALRAWATRSGDGSVRIVLINDSLSARAGALVRPPRTLAGARATLARLTAPSAYAKTGVTLGGDSFGSATSTGQLEDEKARPVHLRGGALSLTLPPASAALLTLTP
jgi:hypothetical protein